MGRPRTGEHEVETRERLLSAAGVAFAEAGYAAARLEDIAGAAGVRRPSLLYHFPSKEALYDATVRRAFRRLGEALAAAMGAPGGFVARLDAVVSAARGSLDAHPEVARLILRELLDGRGPGHTILAEEVGPLLDGVEAFLRRQGGVHLRPGADLRGAVLEVATNMLVRASAGPLRPVLWGPEAGDEARARALCLKEDP